MNIDEVTIPTNMVEVLDVLSQTRKGGFAVIKGYESKSDRTESEIADITFNSRFSYENLLKKKVELLSSIRFEDLEIKSEKLLALDETEQKKQFIACKAAIVASVEKTLAGVREDAHRIAHDTFYVNVDTGVKIHLKTEKVDGKTELVLENGKPVAESIMISALEVGRRITKEGKYKIVNSGTKVLMDNCIAKALKEKGFRDIKTLSLKEGNFESLHISNMEIV